MSAKTKNKKYAKHQLPVYDVSLTGSSIWYQVPVSIGYQLRKDKMCWDGSNFIKYLCVPVGSPSRGGDVMVYAFDIS